MTLRWILGSLHLAALGIGVAAVAFRARALRRASDDGGVRAVLRADAFWGVAAVLWLVTGLWRAFGGLEKGSAYYLQHPLFHAKLGLFVLILGLEIWPMVTFIRWRTGRRRGRAPDLTRTALFARISTVQLVLVFAMVFLATAIARGMGT